MLTPVDIQNKEFGRAMRGYHTEEVDDFMRDLLMDYERLYRENATLKEKTEVLNETIARYKTMEETMQNALVVAQHTAEDIKAGAYGKSDNIIKEAQLRADEIIARANQQISALAGEYSRIYGEVESFRARMSSLLAAHNELLKEIPPYKELGAGTVDAVKAAPATQPAEPEPKPVEEPQQEKEFDIFRNIEIPKPEKKKEEAPQDTRPVPEMEQHGRLFEHVPKVNPLIDELLGRAKEEKKDGPDLQPYTTKTQEEAPQEMVFEVGEKAGDSFDIFKDDPLD